jgi:hypothetical protein
MKWKPFNSGTPYTCKDCPAYVELLAERDSLKRRVSDLEMIIKFMQNGDEIYEVR